MSFLKAFSRLIARHPGVSIQLKIIGHVDPDVSSSIERANLDHAVSVLGPMSFLDCADHLCQADALLLVEAPCEEGIFLPSKLIDYAEAGRPVFAISPQVGVVKDLNQVFNFGVVTSESSEEELYVCLDDFYTRVSSNEAAFDLKSLAEHCSPLTVMTALDKILLELRSQ